MKDEKYDAQYTNKNMSFTVIMICFYIFLYIERPWESISYIRGIQIERWYAILMILIALIENKFKIISSPTNKWVYALLALQFVLAPFAFRPDYAVDQGIEYSKIIILYLLMLSVVEDESTLKILVKSYVISMMIYVLHSLFEYTNGRHDYKMGISRMLGVDSTYSDPNAFGASVVLAIPFVFALLKTEDNKLYRCFYYLYFGAAVICVILTGSRSASLALLFVILMWCISQQGKRKIFSLLIALVTICVVWAGMPDEKKERIRTLWDDNAGPVNAHESAKGRMAGFEVSWKMFKQRPFTGVGAGGNNFIGYRMANNIDEAGQASPTESHVLYGQVLAEFGVFGAIVFIGFVASLFRCCFFARKCLREKGLIDGFSYKLGGAIIVGLLLLLFLGFAGHNFYRPLWLWAAAWSGSLLLITKRTIQLSVKGE